MPLWQTSCAMLARHNVNLSYFCVAAFVTLNKRLFWWKEMLAFNKVVIKFGHVSKVSSLQGTAEQSQQYTQYLPPYFNQDSGLQPCSWLTLLSSFKTFTLQKSPDTLRVKYCLFGGKLLADLGGAHHSHPRYGKNPPTVLDPFHKSIKTKLTNKLGLYIILVHLFLSKYL